MLGNNLQLPFVSKYKFVLFLKCYMYCSFLCVNIYICLCYCSCISCVFMDVVWVLGIELRCSGIVAVALTFRAITLAQLHYILKFNLTIFYYLQSVWGDVYLVQKNSVDQFYSKRTKQQKRKTRKIQLFQHLGRNLIINTHIIHVHAHL